MTFFTDDIIFGKLTTTQPTNTVEIKLIIVCKIPPPFFIIFEGFDFFFSLFPFSINSSSCFLLSLSSFFFCVLSFDNKVSLFIFLFLNTAFLIFCWIFFEFLNIFPPFTIAALPPFAIAPLVFASIDPTLKAAAAIAIYTTTPYCVCENNV